MQFQTVKVPVIFPTTGRLGMDPGISKNISDSQCMTRRPESWVMGIVLTSGVYSCIAQNKGRAEKTANDAYVSYYILLRVCTLRTASRNRGTRDHPNVICPSGCWMLQWERRSVRKEWLVSPTEPLAGLRADRCQQVHLTPSRKLPTITVFLTSSDN